MEYFNITFEMVKAKLSIFVFKCGFFLNIKMNEKIFVFQKICAKSKLKIVNVAVGRHMYHIFT